MLSTQDFSKLYPNCKDPEKWVNAMNELFPQYNITTPRRIASFIAQCGHESGGWRVFSENLNYSARALNSVFGKYFYKAGRNAEEYARQPEKIANIVYANRMGNGNTESGEGWKYRGRGPIQLTGKNNYTIFSNNMDVDAINNPDLVSSDPEIALMSAIWFWNNNGLNRYADRGDIRTMTRRINGGYIGLSDRIEHYESALKLLTTGEDIINISDIGILRKGSKGDGVKLLQEKLGLKVDGAFGPATERALRNWQRSKGLIADGVAGPNTLRVILSS